MNVPTPDIYEFDEFHVDSAKRLLAKQSGEVLPLAPKAFETLLYLVRHPGRLLEKEELMRAVWVDTIVEENNLNQSISAIRRILGERHDEHRFIVTVPGRGYRFVAEVNERIKSQVPIPGSEGQDQNSPAELVTNVSKQEFKNGIDRERSRGAEDKNTNRSWLDLLIVVAVVGLGLIALYLSRDSQKPATDGSIRTVAVFPFKPLVAENRNEALELGMADSLISKLSNGEEIIVRPLDSVRRSLSDEQDSLTVGRQLDVEAILDGSIQTSGDTIRVSARLLRVSDGKQLWAEQFEERLSDIFAVQDSISERVAAALQTRLGNKEKKRYTENVEAYQLYMKGRFHDSRLTQPETEKGITYFQQAIEVDPNYALAYVALSNSYRRFALSLDVRSKEALPKAKVAALKAIEIDESLAEAHVALGAIAFWFEWDWQAAEQHYLRALELAPNNASPHRAYAHLLSNTARHEQALTEARRGRELDPVTLSSNALEGQFLLYAGKPDEALSQLQKTIDLDPNFWLVHLIISRAYAEKGMHAEAIAAASKARELSKVNSEAIALIGYSLAKAGETEKARAVFNELLKLSNERYVPPYNFALVSNGLGEREKTLDFLEQGFGEKDVRMTFLKVELKWNNLRNEPRFVDLLKRMKFL